MLRRSLLAAPMILAAASARAADWVPKQPIKILVGYAPGGTADIAARIAADTIAAQARSTPSSSTTRPAPAASSR